MHAIIEQLSFSSNFSWFLENQRLLFTHNQRCWMFVIFIVKPIENPGRIIVQFIVLQRYMSCTGWVHLTSGWDSMKSWWPTQYCCSLIHFTGPQKSQIVQLNLWVHFLKTWPTAADGVGGFQNQSVIDFQRPVCFKLVPRALPPLLRRKSPRNEVGWALVK